MPNWNQKSVLERLVRPTAPPRGPKEPLGSPRMGLSGDTLEALLNVFSNALSSARSKTHWNTLLKDLCILVLTPAEYDVQFSLEHSFELVSAMLLQILFGMIIVPDALYSSTVIVSSLGDFGRSLRHFGCSWDHIGGLFGRFCDAWGLEGGIPGPFHCILDGLDDLWGTLGGN